MEQQLELNMCKAHKDQRAQYYIASEPWNKFCKSCALNKAICGYKIEKILSPQQFENKIVLSSLTQQLKLLIQICERESSQYSHFTEKINQQLFTLISPTLKNIDSFIQQLNSIKSELTEAYESQINRKLNQYHETQSKFFMDSINFKNHLDNLQTNYCDIIMNSKEKKQDEQFSKLTGDIKLQIQRCKRRIESDKNNLIDEYLTKTKTQFTQKVYEFESRVKSIKLLIGNDQKDKNCVNQQKNKQNQVEQKFLIQEKGYHSSRKPSQCSLMNLDANCEGKTIHHTHRLTSLTLKGSKRNNSIPIKNKNSKILEF